MLPIIPCLAIGLFCLTAPALAGPEVGRVGDITVTGAPLPPPDGDALLSIVRIDRQRLSMAGSERLESILADIAGFQMFRRSDSRSAHPTSQGATLRGLGGNAASRALVVLDGVPIDDPFGGWVNWTAVDPNGLSSVRVVRGGGLGGHGPGALAGVVELESSLDADAPAADADLGFGGRDALSARASVSVPMADGVSTLWGRLDRGDGFAPVTAADRGLADRPAPYRQMAMRFRSAFPAGPDGEMQMALGLFDDQRDRGFDFSDSRMRGGDFSLRYVGSGVLPLELLGYARLRDFRTSFAALSPGREEARQSLDQHTPAHGFGVKAEIRPNVGKLQGRIGADLALRSGDTREYFSFVAASPTRRRMAGGRSMTAGLFATLGLPVSENLLLTGDVRLDRWRLSNGKLREVAMTGGTIFQDVRPAGRSGMESTGRIAAGWQAEPEVLVRISGYRSFRLPTLNELYRPFRAGADGTAANPLLEPEKLRGVEAGLDWQAGQGVSIGLTGYWNRLGKAIANVSVAKVGNQCAGVGFVMGACRIRRNLDAVTVHGIEADAAWTGGLLQASLSYAYSRARITGGGTAPALDGLRPAQTPAHQVSGRITWQSDRGFTSGLSARYQSARFEDDLERIRLNDAFTLDASIGIPLTRRLRAELRAENLLDTHIQAARSDDGTIERAAPRTIWLSLSLR